MSNVVGTKNSGHYQWGDGCDGWHLVRQDGLSVIQERVPPGKSERLHYHKKLRQFFFLLDGTATLVVGGKPHILKAREGIEIPPMTPHQLRNDFHLDLVFLVVSAPESYGDREDL